MKPEVTIAQWEKYLRTRIASEQSIRWVGVRQLLDELDRLRNAHKILVGVNKEYREKLAVAVEAMNRVMDMGDNGIECVDDCYCPTCILGPALAKIGGDDDT